MPQRLRNCLDSGGHLPPPIGYIAPRQIRPDRRSIIKLQSLTAAIIICTSCAFADAGFLRSIVQNPVPASSSHTTIEMSSEDVLIEIYPGGSARITAGWSSSVRIDVRDPLWKME